jgi:diketogulonate reductase-like aldo/keto reductase
VPIPGTSHRHRLEENAAAVSLKISADTEDALPQVFAPGAASGLRYPGEPPRASRDLTRTVMDGYDVHDHP